MTGENERWVGREERAREMDLDVAKAVADALEYAAACARERADAAQERVALARRVRDRARERGGDYGDRLEAALRDALAIAGADFQSANAAARDMYQSERRAGYSREVAAEAAAREARGMLADTDGAAEMLSTAVRAAVVSAADWMADDARRSETQDETAAYDRAQARREEREDA